ncbi:class II aldolase/adducin family protein [Haliangium sp.]|uniref:class II aldolase/adducin family protein n=1 Tax=Haliangium sp. TaxID=2663208 RepID=UPI003D0CB2D5
MIEGVIKFSAEHQRERLPSRRFGALGCELTAWREIMSKTQLVGRDPHLYAGAGYGNVSGRVGPPGSPLGGRAMLITGTQTGGLPQVGLDDYCLVERYDYRRNQVWSRGLVEPSSETMTHGAIYDLSPHIRFVFHGHSAVIWQQARELGIPWTDPAVPYGTPEMAMEVQRLYRTGGLSERRIVAMGGHEDGVVVFGRNAEEAGQVLMVYLARAYARTCRVGQI